ncbi:MAG: prolipoprotein diacylglyceryl transferase [Desulfotomaculales bacterium]
MVVDLNPVAFHVGPLVVRWYGIFMVTAMIVGTVYFVRRGKQQGIHEDLLLNLVLLVLLAGIAGARLLFVLVNFPAWFVHDPVQVLKLYQGGLAWHGGLGAGLLAGWLYCRARGLNAQRLADLTVPGLALGYMLVRVGNIFNQEVLGRFTALGFERWPTQPIGAAIALVLLARYFLLQRQTPPAGYQFWSFVFYHQLLRGLVEETLREMPLALPVYLDPYRGIALFTLGQLVTPVILVLAWWFMRRARQRAWER